MFTLLKRYCYINGYAVEANSLTAFLAKEIEEFQPYNQTTLAQESIRALTPESLAKLQQQTDNEKGYALHLHRLNPYTCDLIKPLFNEMIDRECAKKLLAKVSEDYKTRRRGIGSRSKPINIDQLLISRGINLQKYSRSEIITLPRGNKIGVYLQCFSIGNQQQFPVASIAYGILNNEKIEGISQLFEIVYLLATVEKKAWLLVEEYLKDFARPASALSNGEGYVKKFYVSARKFIVLAKVNIKLEDIGYSAWIPFGLSKEFPTFESATEEIRKRLINSGLPGLKVTFKRETIEK
jgi:hypothetical protein